VTVAALGAKTFRSESGLRFTAGRFQLGFGDRHPDHPRGKGTEGSDGEREAAVGSALVRLPSAASLRCAPESTVSPRVGCWLLKGRTVTTHWRFCADVAARFPELNVDSNVLYLRDGKFYTSAGVTAGIDLSLALIEEDFGPQVALSVARELVVFVRRSGGQEQYQNACASRPRPAAVSPIWCLGCWTTWTATFRSMPWRNGRTSPLASSRGVSSSNSNVLPAPSCRNCAWTKRASAYGLSKTVSRPSGVRLASTIRTAFDAPLNGASASLRASTGADSRRKSCGPALLPGPSLLSRSLD